MVFNVSFEELEKVAKPLVQLLKEKGHQNMCVIINDSGIRIVEDIIYVPIKEKRPT